MTTQTTIQSQAKPASAMLSIAIVALTGAVILFTAGLSHSQTLHDAAHDTRHSTGFPCH